MTKKQKTSKRKQESGDTKHHFSSNYVGIILVGIVIIWAVLNQLYINNLINHGPTQVVMGTIDSKCRVNRHYEIKCSFRYNDECLTDRFPVNHKVYEELMVSDSIEIIISKTNPKIRLLYKYKGAFK